MRTEKLLFSRVEARLLPLHHPTHLQQHHRVQHVQHVMVVVVSTVLSLHSASLLLCTTKEDCDQGRHDGTKTGSKLRNYRSSIPIPNVTEPKEASKEP